MEPPNERETPMNTHFAKTAAATALRTFNGPVVARYHNRHVETYASATEAAAMLAEDGYVFARPWDRKNGPVYIWRKGDAAEACVEHAVGILAAA
jgi:hypothetical protein